MDVILIVLRPFGPHNVGDVISDTVHIQQILAGEHAYDVVRVKAPGKIAQRTQEV